MANLFQTVEATMCKGEMDPKCENFVNQQRLLAHKHRCEMCGGPVREITKPDFIKIGAAVLAALLISGVGTYMVAPSIQATIRNLIGGRVPVNPDQPDKPQKPGDQASSIAIQIENDSGSRTSLADMDKSGSNTYRARQRFRAGDKFRIHVNGKQPYLYVFNKSSADAKRFAAGSVASVSLPSANDWFSLDDNPGVEEFLVISSSSPLSALEDLGEAPPTGRLEDTLRNLSSREETKIVRLQLQHQ